LVDAGPAPPGPASFVTGGSRCRSQSARRTGTARRQPDWRISPPPTIEVGNSLQSAFDHFNKELFDNRLSWCLIRIQRAGKTTLGYFHKREFATLSGDAETDGITINSRYIRSRGAR
jgi:hypothetical protein